MHVLSFYILHISFAARAAFTTIIPRSIPVLYAAIGGLLLKGVNPLLLTVSLTIGAILGTCLCRIGSGWILKLREKRKNNNAKNKENRFITIIHSRTQKHIPTFVQWKSTMSAWRKTFGEKIEHYLHTGNNKRLLFFCLALGIQSSIPDILIILAVRKKVSFPFFIGAIALGKLFVYTPFIYAVELIKLFPFLKPYLS